MFNDILNRFVGKCVEIWITDSKHIHRGILKRLEKDDAMYDVVILLSSEPALNCLGNGDLHMNTSTIYAVREVKPYDFPAAIHP